MLETLPEIWALVIALALYLIGGMLKGAMGFGLPILAIPVMTVTHSLPVALTVAIVPTVATNIAQLWSFRAHRQIDFLPKFLGFGAIGLCFGAFTLSRVNDAYVEISLGIMVLLYLTSALLPAAPRVGGKRSQAPAFGFLAGTVHGATGLSGLVGPPYMHALKLDRPVFVFAAGSMFTLFSLMQAPVLFAFGLFEEEGLRISFLVLPFAFVGLYLGGLIGARMKSQSFSRAVLVVLALAAIMPIVNGVKGLIGG